MTSVIEKLELKYEFDVTDQDALFEAAKKSLERLRANTVAKHGEDNDYQYSQPMDTLIAEELHDPDTGEVHLASCVMVILDEVVDDIPGVDMVGTFAGSKR